MRIPVKITKRTESSIQFVPEAPVVRFAAWMYERYAAQWDIMHKSGLLSTDGLSIHGIWDDHDFGSNNACGMGINKTGDKKYVLSQAKQQIARRLFRDFL